MRFFEKLKGEFTLRRTSLREDLVSSQRGFTLIRTRLRRNLVNVQRGFTLIELLVVVAIIGVLATSLVVAVNPQRQLAKARDTERETDLVAILGAIYQYTSEHNGELPDTDGDPDTSNFPTSLTCIGTGASCFDLAGAGDTGETMVPVYLAEIPRDPQTGTNADTGYLIMVDENNRLTASASGETKTITITR